MQKVIVSDTCSLIPFDKIGEFELLRKVFGNIHITTQVSDEFKKTLPKWVHITDPKSNLHKSLAAFLDLGEATSISLAMELKDCLLIMHEAKGRKVAKELGIAITGSLGILVIAKKNGFLKSIKPILNKIRETNFRISDELFVKVVNLADEKI